MNSRTLKLELPVNLSTDEVRLLLAIKLSESDKVSLGQASKMAGFSKRSFLEGLRQRTRRADLRRLEGHVCQLATELL